MCHELVWICHELAWSFVSLARGEERVSLFIRPEILFDFALLDLPDNVIQTCNPVPRVRAAARVRAPGSFCDAVCPFCDAFSRFFDAFRVARRFFAPLGLRS